MGPLTVIFTLTATKVIDIRMVNILENGIELISGTADYNPAYCLIKQLWSYSHANKVWVGEIGYYEHLWDLYFHFLFWLKEIYYKTH